MRVARKRWRTYGQNALDRDRDSLAKEVARYIKAAAGDFLSVNAALQQVTTGLKSTTVPTRSYISCTNGHSSWTSRDRSSQTLTMGDQYQKKRFGDEQRTLSELVQCYSDNIWQGRACERDGCGGKIMRMRCSALSLPPLLCLEYCPWSSLLADEPIRFRYYTHSPAGPVRKCATYLTRAIVMLVASHFSIIQMKWRCGRRASGLRWDGLRAGSCPEYLGPKELHKLLQDSLLNHASAPVVVIAQEGLSIIDARWEA